MEALVGCVAQTGQSGGRLVSGPPLPLPGWMHYLTAESLQAAAQPGRGGGEGGKVSASLDALTRLSAATNPPFAPFHLRS